MNTLLNIQNALQYLDPNCDHETWIKIGTALKSEGDKYLKDWDRWSSSGSSYKTGVCDRHWKHLQANKVSIGTLFHLAKQNGFELDKDGNYDASKIEAERQSRQIKREADAKAKLDLLPSLQERDRKIKGYPNKLSQTQNGDLVKRGAIQTEIGFCLANNWLIALKGGYGVVAIDPITGYSVGCQKALDDRSERKYTWGLFSGQTQLRETGKNPLPVWQHPNFDSSKPHSIHTCEKYLGSLVFALKLWRKDTQAIVIGAAGGVFDIEALERVLTAYPHAIEHICYPDGDITTNKGVRSRFLNCINNLVSLNCDPAIAWWGQTTKAAGDIDEIASTETFTQIQHLSPEEFEKLLPQTSSNQVAEKPKTPLHWLLSKFAKKKKQPRKVDRLPEAVAITYNKGDRQKFWIDALKGNKNILDSSFTGSGKSHAVGLLRPEMLGVKTIIYVTTDPRNVTTKTLKDWTVLTARHNGLTDKQGKTRRAVEGDSNFGFGNCSRTDAIAQLRNKGITDTKIVCETCPVLNMCRSSGFKAQRAKDHESNRFISHPLSLPNPDDFDYADTKLIWEEPTDSFKVHREVKVSAKDIDNLIVKLALDGRFINFMPMLQTLKTALGDRSRFGLDYHTIKNLIGDIPLITDELKELLKPDLSILDTVEIHDSEFEKVRGQKKRELSKVNTMLKKMTRLNGFELETKIENELLKQWFIEFLDILNGSLNGDVAIGRGQITVTIADDRLREIAVLSAGNLFLDATIHQSDLEAKLGAPVTVVKQSGVMPMARVIQVPDLGRMGKQRGNEQSSRKDAIVKHLKAKYPDNVVKVVDFKDYEADGAWWRDSRGSNDFIDADILIAIGAPCQNLGALRAEYSTIHGLHPDKDDQDFGAWVDRKIHADIRQCFGRKAGDHRCKDGDVIYFLSDFDLGDIPHDAMLARDITSDAMSKDELIKKAICDRVTDLKTSGIDLLAMSERKIGEWLELTRQQFRSAKFWVMSLLRDLYSATTQDLNEITDDKEQVAFWTGATEKMINDDVPLVEISKGVITFFNDWIPKHLQSSVAQCLKPDTRIKLISILTVLSADGDLELIAA